MNSNLVPIIVQKEGISDTTYKVVELYTKNGTKVKEDDPILCFETSKMAIDVEASVSGYIFYDVNEFDEVEIGQTIAVISSTPSIPKGWFASVNKSKKTTKNKQTIDTSQKISKPAQKLIDQHNIDITVFNEHSIITKEDVQSYIESRSPKTEIDFSINEKSILIFGGGGHSKMCIEILKQTKTHEIIGVTDRKLPINSLVLGIPILGSEAIIDHLIQKGLKNVILAVGAVLNHGSREKLFSFLKEKQLYVPNIIHPSALLEPSVTMGEGNQIMQGAIVGSDVKIGNNCIINSGCIISHDVVLGDNVHIAPGAVIAGNVSIDNNTVIGMNATVFLDVKIGKHVMVSNGVHIFTDVPDGVGKISTSSQKSKR